MQDGTVSAEKLASLTGYRRQADIEKWLVQHNVRFFYGKNGVWTTLDALNFALGIPRDPERTQIQFNGGVMGVIPRVEF
jgi:hypothetical protein